MSYANTGFSGLSALFKIDLKLFVLVMLIVIIGLATLFSVSGGDHNLIIKQSIRIVVGLTAMILLAQIHPLLTTTTWLSQALISWVVMQWSFWAFFCFNGVNTQKKRDAHDSLQLGADRP